MRFLLAVVSIDAAATAFAVANPIAIDSSRRPVALTDERVEIAVHPKQSVISGTYSFRQLKDDLPSEPADHVVIEVPIIAQGRQSFASLQSSAAAAVVIGTHQFRASGSSIGASPRGLPADWKLHFLEFEIPLRALHPKFTAVIHYTQLHLPGDISAYYPIRPPDASASNCIVRYTAATPVSLILLSKRVKAVEIRPTRIAVQPEHNRMILVRAIKR